MPNKVSLRTTALLIALAFGLTFAVQALGGGSSAATPTAKKSAVGSAADAPGAAPDLRLVAATVPALREPRKPRKPKVHHRKPARKPTVRKVVSAPRYTPTPMTPAPRVQPTPTPTAAPRYIPPAPRHVTPKPAPKATPAPTEAPSGEFDTSGEQP